MGNSLVLEQCFEGDGAVSLFDRRHLFELEHIVLAGNDHRRFEADITHPTDKSQLEVVVVAQGYAHAVAATHRNFSRAVPLHFFRQGYFGFGGELFGVACNLHGSNKVERPGAVALNLNFCA